MRRFVDKLLGKTNLDPPLRVEEALRARLASAPGSPSDREPPAGLVRSEPGPEVEIVAEATHLSQELLRLYQAGAIEQAAEVAERLVSLKRDAFGDRHPEYATALCHRSLLLQGLGKLKESERGLRAVLDIRQEVLGRQHPIVATTLSQLGMLLVESRQWDEAEGALAASLSIRRGFVPDDHPSLDADRKMLQMLTERRSQAAAQPSAPVVSVTPPPQPAPEPAVSPIPAAASQVREPVTIPSPTVPPALSSPAHPERHDITVVGGSRPLVANRDQATIREEMKTLAGAFTKIGAALSIHGRQMMAQGVPPNPRLLFEATSCHRHFASLCDEAIRRSEALDLDHLRFLNPAEDRFALPDLTALFDEIFKLEGDSVKNSQARKTTLALARRVLQLTHADPQKNPILKPLHELAESLQDRVRETPPGRAPAEALAIAEGRHPLVAIVRLANSEPDQDELDDETWTQLYETLAATQGTKIAAAAARKRLRSRASDPSTTPADPSTTSDEAASTRTVADVMDSLIDDEDFLPTHVKRGNARNRIVIPDSPALLNRPRSGGVPNPNPSPMPRPAPGPSMRPEGPPNAEKSVKDPYEFMRNQTSIICQ